MGRVRDEAVKGARQARRAAGVRWVERRRALWGPGSDWRRLVDAGLFDEAWYRDTYPDVALSGHEPLAHFASMGAGQGRNPNRYFDATWYRTTYRDVMADVAHPVFDYLDHGAAAGRDPGPEFDSQWYTTTYPDVVGSGITPLGHYLVTGVTEGRLPRPPDRRRADARHVVVVSGEPETPGHRYRAVRLAEAVERSGSTAVVLTVAEAASARAGEVARADVTVLWRTGWSAELRQVIDRSVRARARLVFDIDDLMFDPALATVEVIDGIRSQGLAEDDVQSMYALVRRAAVHAQAATCTTPELAQHLRALGLVTHVLPNGYDDDTLVRSRLAVRRRRAEGGDGLCRIGYASGSRTHQRDFAVAADALADILRAHAHTRLVVFRRAFDLDEFPQFDDLRDQVEWRELVPLDGLADELARLDVNLVPLEVGNAFCEAKSELKHFEAALVDVPTVASPTGPFRRAISHGATGMLADGPDEWREALDELVTDPDLRASMGRAAREAVAWPFGPERRVQLVAAVLDQVCGDETTVAAAFELERARERRAPADPPRWPRCARCCPAIGCARRWSPSWCRSTTTPTPWSRRSTRSRARRWPTSTSWSSRTGRPTTRSPWSPPGSSSMPAASTGRWCWHTPTTPAWRAPATAASTTPRRPTCCRSTPTTCSRPGAPPACSTRSRGRAPRSPFPRCACSAPTSTPASPRSSWAATTSRRRDWSPATTSTRSLWSAGRPGGLSAATGPACSAGRTTRCGARSPRPGSPVGGSPRISPATGCTTRPCCARSPTPATRWPGPAPPSPTGTTGSTSTHGPTSTAACPMRSTPSTPGPRTMPTATQPPAPAPSGRRARAPTPAPPTPPATASPPAVPHRRPRSPRTTPTHPEGTAGERTGAMTPAPLASSGERATATGESGAHLSGRARSLLPLLRCPETGEALEEAPDGGLRTTGSGRRWPVVAGRPVLFPGMESPEVIAAAHAGNPLPERGRALVAATSGRVLHLSGGGTVVEGDHVVDVDAAIFGATDVVGDAHRLPFADETFDLVVAMNAFEHYRDPHQVVATLHRLLRPGGTVFVHTAFLQPLHEEPHHYFNTTRYGLEQWFAAFDTVDLTVSDNFLPGFTLSWLASESEAALAHDVSTDEAARFRATPMGRFSDFWRDAATRAGDDRWRAFASLGSESRERLAAGFEYVGRRPGPDGGGRR